jgi:hypothetical protein
MTHTFRRPVEQHLSVERTPVPGACGECGAEALAEYRVLSDGGWFDVRKCQRCLASASREPALPFGSYVPLGLEISRSFGG